MAKDKKQKKQKGDWKRNQHWTEEPKGRPIDFAEKYDNPDGFSHKFDAQKQASIQLAKRKQERKAKQKRAALSIFLAVVLVIVGYIGMDVRLIRHNTNIKQLESQAEEGDNILSQMTLELASMKIESIGLDNSIMLDSIIADAHNKGFNSVTFDAKRSDGTIGYQSSLALVDTLGAMNSVASDVAGSVAKLMENDIVPVARICCYADNALPLLDNDLALVQNWAPYRDRDGQYFLDPSNDQVYSYIRDIVRELSDSGVQIFVLYGCDIPESFGDEYMDGFEPLAARLNEELGARVRFISESYQRINGTDSETGRLTNSAIVDETKGFSPLGDNQIYHIYADMDQGRLCQLLIENEIHSFILE